MADTSRNEKHGNGPQLQNVDEENALVTKKFSTTEGQLRQIFLTIFVSLLMTSLGMTMGFTAIFLPQIRNESDPVYMNDDIGSWYASVNNLAAPFGSLTAGVVMDYFGRRMSIFIPIIPMILLYAWTSVTESVTSLFVCRLLLGYFTNFIPVSCQIYLAECADPILRSFTVNVNYISMSSGVVIVFVLGAFLQWRTIAWMCTILPAITLMCMVITPDSPIWLARNGHNDAAFKSLLWLRGNRTLAAAELDNIVKRYKDDQLLEQQQTDLGKNFWTQKYVYRPTLIISMFLMLFQFSGTYLFNYYAVDIAVDMNFRLIDKSTAIIAMSTIRLVVLLLFCCLFMNIARRKIYLFVGIGSTLSTTALAIYMSAGIANVIDPIVDMCVKCALMTAYMATNSGFQIIPGFMYGEMLPAKVRGRVGGYLSTWFNVFSFILTKLYPSVRHCIGIAGILVVWAAASFASTTLLYATVPETRGKTLDEVEDYFRSSGWIYRRQRAKKSTDNAIAE